MQLGRTKISNAGRCVTGKDEEMKVDFNEQLRQRGVADEAISALAESAREAARLFGITTDVVEREILAAIPYKLTAEDLRGITP